MPDPRDFKLDITGLARPAGDVPEIKKGKPFLSVMFNCCRVYMRVYCNAAGNAYEARCPRCGKRARFTVGVGGTSERTFVVE